MGWDDFTSSKNHSGGDLVLPVLGPYTESRGKLPQIFVSSAVILGQKRAEGRFQLHCVGVMVVTVTVSSCRQNMGGNEGLPTSFLIVLNFCDRLPFVVRAGLELTR